MNVNDFLRETREPVHVAGGYEFLKIRPRIVCTDGFSLSVQASDSHYCTPRCGIGPYSAVEVGYPSARPPASWAAYYDGEWQRTGLLGCFQRAYRDRHSVWFAIWHREWRYLQRLLAPADNACTGVYGYVPVELVEALIESHGGQPLPEEAKK